eukprot:scaffold13454_cov20-Tisochrysis_lutea.AAC.1
MVRTAGHHYSPGTAEFFKWHRNHTALPRGKLERFDRPDIDGPNFQPRGIANKVLRAELAAVATVVEGTYAGSS